MNDVLMLVCDGLKGLPEAVETVWPKTIVQTCVVHLLRNIGQTTGERRERAYFIGWPKPAHTSKEPDNVESPARDTDPADATVPAGRSLNRSADVHRPRVAMGEFP